MQSVGKRERLRFAGLSVQARPDGSRLIVIELEWGDQVFRGEALGTGTLEGDLLASGRATAAAAQAATLGRVTVTLKGIKAVRAFDGRVIVASVEVRRGDRTLRLLGAQALTEGDLSPAGVLTVLGAINRVITPHLSGGEGDSELAVLELDSD